MTTHYYMYRKNWGQGVLAIQLNATPGYPDDPLYDEIALEADHTLPGAGEADLTETFRLVIWSNSVNPGFDPGMEIVTAQRTDHPRVYQITQRGEEDTVAVAHPVGSYVGLHYTAGVSEHDLAPIQSILDAVAGSIVYTWEDVWGQRSIGILPPGYHQQILHTAGTGQPPYWDWVFGLGIRIINIWIFSGYQLVVIVPERVANHTVDYDETYTDYGTNYGPNADWFYTIDVEHADSDILGSIEAYPAFDTPDLSGGSYSDPTIDHEIEVTEIYTDWYVTPVRASVADTVSVSEDPDVFVTS
jgi:hypothetical protein